MLIKEQSPSKNPRTTVLMGLPKIGKTTIAAQLDNSLLIDFERGTEFVTHPSVASVTNYADLRVLFKEIMEKQKGSNPYKYCIWDTVTGLEMHLNRHIAGEHGVSSIEEIAYGAGYGALRSKLMSVLDWFTNQFDHLVVLGHLKKRFIERTNGKLDTEFEIELTGKLAPIFMSQMDSIGLLFREKKEVFCKFLEASEDDEVIIGSRVSRLDGNVLQLTKGRKDGVPIADWSEIFLT